MHSAINVENILEVENLSFSYDGKEDALQGVTLAVRRGDYVGLVGPNGAGKTTLLKIMLRLLPLSSGSVRLFGVDVREFSEWEKIGYVPQTAVHFDVNFPVSVYEVAMMGRYKSGSIFQRLRDVDRDAVKDSLTSVDMWDFRDRLIGDLSGGQEQRVFIARALVNRPEILFLDEPTTGVDTKTQDGFYSLLRKLNGEAGITLVLVSHDIDRIVREVTHLACVDRSLIRYLSPEAYRAESASTTIFERDIKVEPHRHHYA